MAFFAYENWVHKYARVHRGECAHCNNGRGSHDATDSRAGQWLGPFDRYDQALGAAMATGFIASSCGHCAPG